MADRINVYFDYSCPYTYRVWRWLCAVQCAGRTLEIGWKPFSLKEHNRGEDAPSLFEQPSRDLSLLRLELAKATQATGATVFEHYHSAMYEALHGAHKRQLSHENVYALAQKAGLDLDQFKAEQQNRIWIDQVARDHREGSQRWHVFGTPTLVFDQRATRFLKFTDALTEPQAAADLFATLEHLLQAHSELVEIKAP